MEGEKNSNYVLSEDDVRSIVKILSSIVISDATVEQKQYLLLEGVAKLIDVDCWSWTLISPTLPGNQVSTVNFRHGGFSEDRLAFYLEAIEHPDMARLNKPFIEALYKNNTHTTLSRQQLDPTNIFPTLSVYPLWVKANISQLILSCHPFSDGSMSLLGLYRREDQGAFGARERKIAHIIFSEVVWLHSAAWPEKKLENCFDYLSLSPRQRVVLNLLLEGLGRKQIAGQLGISENTVASYAKEIYRFYKVQSHAQLVSRFRFGNGGDQINSNQVT